MKIIKSLILSDIHLDTFSRFGVDPVTGLSRRLLDQKKALEQVLKILTERNIDNIQFLGDWFNQDIEINTNVYALTHWFFSELEAREIAFYAVRGNHDLVKKENPKVEWEYALYPFLKPLKTPLNIYYGHYDIQHDCDKIKNFDLVLMHQTPKGSRIHSHVFEEGFDWQTLAKNNKLVLAGHNHHRQPLSDNAHVIGCFIPLTFGDTGLRGVEIWENGKLEFIQLDAPRFITVDSREDDGKRDPKDYYRITYSGKNEIIDNEVYIRKPTYFDSQIKSTELVDILKEWLILQGKSEDYLSVIQDLLQTGQVGQSKIRDLRLRRVELTNFLSFEHSILEVNNGLNLVEGVGGDFKSNGTGKSSLFEAIYWCLWGETTKGLTGDDVIRKYPEKQKDCEVELYLSNPDNDHGYFINRSRKSGLQVRKCYAGCECEGEEPLTQGMKSKESQEYLERLLGFNKTTFCASSYFSQDQVLLLTKLGVADKSSMITELLGFNQYDSLSEAVASKIAERTEILLKYKEDEYKWVTRNQWLQESIKTSTDRAAKMIQQAEETKAEGVKIKLEILVIEKEFVKSEYPTVDTSKLDKEEESLISKIEVVDCTINRLERELEAVDVVAVTTKVLNIKTEIAIRRKAIDKLEKEIGTLQNSQNKECSHCGMLMTDQHKTKLLSKLAIETEELEQEEVKFQQQLALQVAEEKELVSFVSEMKARIGELKGKKIVLNKELLDLGKRRQQELVEVTNREQKEAKRLALKEKLTIYKEAFDQLKIDFDQIKAQVEKEQAEVDHNKLVIQSAAETTLAVSDQIKQLTFWKEAFSFRGIRSLLLYTFCNEVNVKLAEYTLEVSNGRMSIEFSPVSTIKSGESRNRLDLLIYLGGNLQSYESLSGGERKRADIGVALAFSKWIKTRFSLTSALLGLLILDELMDSLDTSARECILPLLKREGENQAVFLITHSNDCSAEADRIIKVTKKNRISSVESI